MHASFTPRSERILSNLVAKIAAIEPSDDAAVAAPKVAAFDAKQTLALLPRQSPAPAGLRIKNPRVGRSIPSFDTIQKANKIRLKIGTEADLCSRMLSHKHCPKTLNAEMEDACQPTCLVSG